MSGDDLPEPPVPPDADLRHFPDMPLQVGRLRDSGLATVPDAEVRWANLMSWCVAWHQLPAGSLPDDDAQLSHLMGYGRDTRRWRSLRAKGALRGWVKCRDGRLYHPVLAETCLRVVGKSRASRSAVMARWNRQATEKPGSNGYDRSADALPRREGKGREGIESTSSLPFPNGKEREEASTPGGAEPSPPVPIERKTAADAIPLALLQELCGIWNDMAAAKDIPQVSELNPRRQAAFRARIRERWAKDPRGKFTAYCDVIGRLPFCRGENDRGWQANIDWALRPGTPAAVAEGKYGQPDDEGDG